MSSNLVEIVRRHGAIGAPTAHEVVTGGERASTGDRRCQVGMS